jgi:hypothetical protein
LRSPGRNLDDRPLRLGDSDVAKPLAFALGEPFFSYRLERSRRFELDTSLFFFPLLGGVDAVCQ